MFILSVVPRAFFFTMTVKHLSNRLGKFWPINVLWSNLHTLSIMILEGFFYFLYG